MQSGIDLIAAARARQLTKWSLAHDLSEHPNGDLVRVALCLISQHSPGAGMATQPQWGHELCADYETNPEGAFKHAAALLAAELDRRRATRAEYLITLLQRTLAEAVDLLGRDAVLAIDPRLRPQPQTLAELDHACLPGAAPPHNEPRQPPLDGGSIPVVDTLTGKIAQVVQVGREDIPPTERGARRRDQDEFLDDMPIAQAAGMAAGDLELQVTEYAGGQVLVVDAPALPAEPRVDAFEDAILQRDEFLAAASRSSWEAWLEANPEPLVASDAHVVWFCEAAATLAQLPDTEEAYTIAASMGLQVLEAVRYRLEGPPEHRNPPEPR